MSNKETVHGTGIASINETFGSCTKGQFIESIIKILIIRALSNSTESLYHKSICRTTERKITVADYD
jgi:hypothetical protein